MTVVNKNSERANEEEDLMNELTIDATTGNLGHVLSFLEEQLEDCNCSPKAQAQLNIAVEEIFVNIAHYGYVPDTGTATIRVETSGDPLRVTVTFFDNGKPFDPLAKKEPDLDLDADERDPGGMGIFMVRQSMDEVRYEYKNGQNILTISKNV